MSFFSSFINFLSYEPAFESKSRILSTEVSVPMRSADEITQMVAEHDAGGDLSFTIGIVNICARIIAEGLALPACHLHKTGASGKTKAVRHPLYDLLNLRPNDRQSSYDFRSMIGYHLALNGNAFVYINRAADGSILELLPCDPGFVSINVDQSRLFGPVTYYLFGQAVPAENMWHLKGPSWLSWEGNNTLAQARRALMLTANTEKFASKLFENAARPGGILMPAPGASLSDEQKADIKASWNAQMSSVNNAHRTAVLTTGLQFTPLSSTANEAQMIEARQYQIEEVCRFFRVSPIKAFRESGSFAYKSVEQSFIMHDADCDGQWHERFVQSANINLLTDAERASGLTISLASTRFDKAPLGEQMAFLTAARASGLMTQNEARELLGLDPSDEDGTDKLTPAVNLFGPKPGPDAATVDQVPSNNG